jgi:hypothetical protein
MRTLSALGFGLWALGGAGIAEAQQARPPAGATENVTLAPIQCWSRPSANSVRVGEIFTVVLTCAVVETQSTTVVPDQTRLDPGALQVPPFEVVGGTQAEDMRTLTHRYFQYEYQLRFVGEQIGADLDVPGPTINYRVQSRVQGDSSIESRDRQYVLPSARVRIVSMVPAAANDIQDPLPESFADMAGRRFRASLLRIVSWVLFGIGAVMVLWALAAVLKRPKAAAAAGPRLAPEAAVLGAALRELAQVKRQRQADGWTSDLAARALAPLRIATAYATGRAVAQVPASAATAAGPGQLRVTSWGPRRRTMLVSGSATAESAGAPVALQTSAPRSQVIVDLQSALATFTAAAYGRGGAAASDSDLDEALELAIGALRNVARFFSPVGKAFRTARRSASGVLDRAWAR